uniref:Uncharacterized protein n=1 Tax=Tanacetum cinerariifolium TaxID=118510 RepID=A0A699HI59_TANCI|nr:hypothetical protein [Tanacetum cinerariifolium]
MARNAYGKSSYANVTGKPSGKKLNICTFFTPGGNGNNVVVSVESIRAISERFANTTYGFFGGSGWHTLLLLTMLETLELNIGLFKWHPDENLLKEDVSTILVWVKLHGVPVTAFSEDGLRAIATKLGAGEKKTLRMPSQTIRGVPVGLKIGFKPQKEYRPIPKKIITSSSGNKKKGMEPTIEVSNSNPFEVLNSIDNDVELGTNGGTTNLVNNEATSSGSSFMNLDNNSNGTTPIIDKIKKFKKLITSGQAILVDEAGNPLKKVEFLGDYDSEDEVASVDNDMARSMALERVGFGTQSLLEQWRDSYGNGDYDEDPYDDDMYEGQDLSQEL